MAKRVEIRVERDGTLRAEFSGFSGDDCIEQAERLQTVLAGLGLLVEPQAVQRKDPAQVRLESGVEEESQERERGKVPGTP